jgi:GTP-binding protein LepA
MNKIDLPHANPEAVADEIIDLIGCKREDILSASAKEGKGIAEILHGMCVSRISAPKGDPKAPIASYDFRFGV